MKFYVYYADDYEGNDGKGFEKFESEKEALKFIEGRLGSEGCMPRRVDHYTLVEGREKELTVVEVATKVKVVR